jgi:uncharacterized membrane protein YqjE
MAFGGSLKGEPKFRERITRLLAALINYIELKLKLLLIEASEATLHLMTLAFLAIASVVLLSAAIVMFGVFLIFIFALLLHCDWGWIALGAACLFCMLTIILTIVLRQRTKRLLFSATLAELRKDGAWLAPKANIEN